MSSIAGRRIKQIREQKGISQNRLAKMANVSQSAISAIENDTKSPSVETIELIARALGCELYELLTEKKQPATESELQKENARWITELTPQELRRVLDFAEGLKAGRSVTDFPHK